MTGVVLLCRSMRVARRTVILGALVASVLAVSALPVRAWRGSPEIHTMLEVAATVLALVVGVLALVRYASKKSELFLFLSVGFLGTGLLDGYHALVSSSFFSERFPSPPPSLIPWSWSASRFFLGLLMSAAWWSSRPRPGETRVCRSERSVFIAAGLLTLASFAFFAFVPLSTAHLESGLLGRPQELIPAALFLVPIIGAFRRGDWAIGRFELCLLASLLVGLLTQTLVMARSHGVFDAMFDLAHVLKLASYALVFVGLSASIYDTFTQVDRSAASLTRANAILRDLDARSREASELKSAFLASMSHELRTPLNAILGLTELLEEDEPSRSRRETLAVVQRNGEHLLQLLNDILDLSRIESGKMSIERLPVSPRALVTEVIALFSAKAAEKGLKLDVEHVTPMPESVESDPTRLRQILLNLVGNAVKFTEKGHVRVFVSYFHDDAEPVLLFEVADTGVGMTADQADRVFDSFTQADVSITRKFGGSGLGLTISRDLARMLGGDIVAQSNLGQGSSFFATTVAPLSPGALIVDEAPPGAPEIAEWKASERESWPVEGRVLVADDIAVNRSFVRSFLARAGADVEIAANGREAVDTALLAEADRPFDLVLMDVQMPELDGLAATRELRERGYRVPIVALTASAMSGDRERCLAAGCDAFLTKPVRRAELLQIAHDQIRARRVAELELG